MAAESGEQRRNRRTSSDLISRCSTSFVYFSLIQLALYMVPYFFPNFSLLTLLPLSAVALLAVAAVVRCCKRLLRVRASAPALVFLSIIFVWGVYIGVIRQVISPLMDFILNTEFLMLMVGLCSILSTDPGFVTIESSHLNKLVENPVSVVEAHSKELVPSTCDMPYVFSAEENAFQLQRVRYCGLCGAYVKGFDHHCPAFGNCIDSAKIKILDKAGHLASLSINLVISTTMFSLLQLLWQGVFLAWHSYCVCFNIRTDEWINWKRYPEFNLTVHPEPGRTPNGSETRFTNPYDKGILSNVKEFLTAIE